MTPENFGKVMSATVTIIFVLFCLGLLLNMKQNAEDLDDRMTKIQNQMQTDYLNAQESSHMDQLRDEQRYEVDRLRNYNPDPTQR